MSPLGPGSKASKNTYVPTSGTFRDQSQGRAHTKRVYRIKTSSEDIPLI